MNNYDTGNHPIHIHGHRIFVLASSEYPGSEYNNNPYYVQARLCSPRSFNPVHVLNVSCASCKVQLRIAASHECTPTLTA